MFKKSGVYPAMQAQKYHLVMLHGFSMSRLAKTTAISKLPISHINYNKRYAPAFNEIWCNISIRYMSRLNWKIIANIHQYITARHEVKKRIKDNTVIVVDVWNLAMALSIVSLAYGTHGIIIGIVTDLPEQIGISTSSIQSKLFYYIINCCDGYVLLTEAMNRIVNPSAQKPYVVIEGQVDSRMENCENTVKNKEHPMVCMYAGSLDESNGIMNLVNGFMLADVPETELHIYGVGDSVGYILEASKKNPKIKYFGSKLNAEIVQAEIRATLLINPRPSSQEFTKYSFPSKNMEYMVSGTPLLTTKLPGMPKEYYKYVFLIKDESAEGIAQELKRIFKLGADVLHLRGLAAKKFVLENKSDVIQAEKIIRMGKKLLDSRTK